MDFLWIIPARAGSKGIPGKNKKLLCGKPLIAYSIECALKLTKAENICISTDDQDIVSIAEKYQLKVPFLRPENLSGDTASAFDVLKHAGQFYESRGKKPDAIVLLQPTSPFRSSLQVQDCLNLYRNSVDMVVSVSKTKPKLNFVENQNGFLEPENANIFYERRQEAAPAYNFNGAVYVINYVSLNQKEVKAYNKIVKYEMDILSSFDIDTPLDWEIAECLLEKKKVE